MPRLYPLFCLALLVALPRTAQAQITSRTYQAGTPWLLNNAIGNGGYIATATADLNGDGAPDLIDVAGVVMLNDGHGAFTAGSTLPGVMPVVGDGHITGATADFDRDGDMDFVALTLPGPFARASDSANVVIFQNDGQANFTAIGRPLSAPWRPTQLIVPDINKDGLADLVILGYADSTQQLITVRINDGTGTSFPGSDARLLKRRNWAYHAIQVADLDGTSAPELLVLSRQARGILPDSLYVWANYAGGPLPHQRGQECSMSGGTLLGPTDLNGDGALDLLSVGEQGGLFQLEKLLNDGVGHLTPQSTSLNLAPGTVLATSAADLDHDGDLDVLLRQQTQLQLFENLGGGQFANGEVLYVIPSASPRFSGVAVADVDLDTDVDLVIDYYDNVDNYARVLFNSTITGLLHPQDRPALTLFPNPAHHRVALTTAPSPEAQAVTVLDALGRTVRTYSLAPQTSHLELPLAGLPAGVYVVRVGAAARRLVVE